MFFLQYIFNDASTESERERERKVIQANKKKNYFFH